MYNISVIGTAKDIALHKDLFAFSDCKVQFTDTDGLTLMSIDPDSAVIVLPWRGFRETLNLHPQLAYHRERNSVIVVGPTHYFPDVEDWVIDGSVCFLSEPLSTSQVRAVVHTVFELIQEKEAFAKEFNHAA